MVLWDYSFPKFSQMSNIAWNIFPEYTTAKVDGITLSKKYKLCTFHHGMNDVYSGRIIGSNNISEEYLWRFI